MIHYHGTPITPLVKLYDLAGFNFCVSYADARDLEICHDIGQSVMIDNGAFTIWKKGNSCPDWFPFYSWVRPWLDYSTTWCVIPDVIAGTEQQNDQLICEWFRMMGSFKRAAPVWHLHESLERLDRLVAGFERVCFGSSGEFAKVGIGRWNDRMNVVFNRICRGSGLVPTWIHMLRGMALSGSDYPFSSVDSTDVAQNHWIKDNVVGRARRWDALQCPARWVTKPEQLELLCLAKTTTITRC